MADVNTAGQNVHDDVNALLDSLLDRFGSFAHEKNTRPARRVKRLYVPSAHWIRRRYEVGHGFAAPGSAILLGSEPRRTR